MRFVLALGIATLCGGAALAAPPSKREVLKALRTSNKDAKRVSEVLADVGGGRFPILYTVRGRDCIERMIDKQKEQHCSETSLPHAGVVGRDAAGAVQVLETLTLPTRAPPWDVPEELKWGITSVKDHDGDGKPELLLIYGYNGETMWAVGAMYYRHLAILNLDKLSLAAHVVLDEKPEGLSPTQIETKWKLVPGELQLTRTVSDFDPQKSDRVAGKPTTSVWKYDAARDQYVDPAPAR